MLEFIFLIVLLIATETSAIALLKQSINYRNAVYAGILAYIGVALIFRMILQKKKLGVANAYWQTGTIISVTLVSVLLFREKYTTREWIGISLAIASVVVFSY